ncbi:MAG: hypothetical protein WBA74_12150 [Cyclobacteriaceae bacterium]
MNKIKKIILAEIPKEELSKLPALAFYLDNPAVEGANIIYERDKTPSSFHNSGDITVSRFHKQSSLIYSPTIHEKIQGK